MRAHGFDRSVRGPKRRGAQKRWSALPATAGWRRRCFLTSAICRRHASPRVVRRCPGHLPGPFGKTQTPDYGVCASPPFLRYGLGLPLRPLALHWRAGVSVNDFTGHEVGARRRLAPTEHAVNQRRGASGELWQPRFPSAGLRACFDRALRTIREYNEKVEYIHLNPVRAGLVSRSEDWRWSSYNEYAGMSADESVSRRTV